MIVFGRVVIAALSALVWWVLAQHLSHGLWRYFKFESFAVPTTLGERSLWPYIAICSAASCVLIAWTAWRQRSLVVAIPIVFCLPVLLYSALISLGVFVVVDR